MYIAIFSDMAIDKTSCYLLCYYVGDGNRFMNRTSATEVIYLLVHALSTILCYFLIS